MNHDRVVAVVERSPIPRRPSGDRRQTRNRSRCVVALTGQLPGLNAETGDQKSADRKPGGEISQDDIFAARLEEDHHVPRQQHQVERSGRDGLGVAEIGLLPTDVGSFRACDRQHLNVRVDADDRYPAPGQFDRHPPGSATGIEHCAPP